MSRIGKLPINMPSGVKASIQEGRLFVEGPKGKLSSPIPAGIDASVENNVVQFSRRDDSGQTLANHGLARSLAANSVKGVSDGFEKKLEIKGVGYRVNVAGQKVEFHLGYSHPIEFALPEGISAEVVLDKATKSFILTLKGIDKQSVGQVAADIRSLRKPEPYKGKGVRYFGETIRLKAGKAGK